ncbi:hypothetical protein MPRM_13760 [Mycobacterium parmense]|uniref:Uncharacterized protein n=1 Tax=Mycobacterium parmense TaxID=185642 RepID=A0A7I7YQD6_9MYCO|nr:hypothetical protein MPRM_13760 [Mycobacterium parmense]
MGAPGAALGAPGAGWPSGAGAPGGAGAGAAVVVGGTGSALAVAGNAMLTAVALVTVAIANVAHQALRRAEFHST